MSDVIAHGTETGSSRSGAADLPSTDELEDMYRLMVTTTTAGEYARQRSRAGKLQAAFYPVRGAEAVCAALGVALEPRDQLVSTYRNLGDALAKGMSLRPIVAEIFGRVDGASKGKGGPMHLHDTSVGFMATTGVVGAGLPIAVGLGTAAQLDGDSRVVVAVLGDGATAIGAYHEAMNLAAVWRLPVLFLCVNNQWAEHTSVREYLPSPNFVERAASYGMTASQVDGFDAIVTWRAIRDAVHRLRNGDGPEFLECQTYRLTGHSSSADYSYVPKDELDAALARDPAPTFKTWLIEEGLVRAERTNEIEGEADHAVAEAFAYGESCPQPGADELYTDVFADMNQVPDLR